MKIPIEIHLHIHIHSDNEDDAEVAMRLDKITTAIEKTSSKLAAAVAESERGV